MNKFTHTKSKSDTDFHNNKIINDDISGSLKFFQNNINKEFKGCNNNNKKVNNDNKGYMSSRQYSFFKKRNTDSQFISILEKILLFKKQIDTFFLEKNYHQ